MILEYILKYHTQDCIQILSEKDNLGYYCLKIDFLKLFESYPDIGDKVLCSPVECLPSCNKDIIKAQEKILEEDDHRALVVSLKYSFIKRNVQARFYGLPICRELHRIVFPKNIDLGYFLKVTGTVVRVTQAKMLEYKRNYVCMKCKHENIVEAEFEKRYILKSPIKCGNKEIRCKCATFSQVHLVSREHCKDYQEIKIQEQVNKLSIGTIPGSMWVVLENDLVDQCKPGDDVNICGIVRRRWRPNVHNKKNEVELVLQANYIEVCNSQISEVVATAPDVKDCFNDFWCKFNACPLKGRDQILSSVCPQVYGLYLVKLAVLLTVVTGSNNWNEHELKKEGDDDKHATKVRGQCHLLLVGDPGTGKSQLLRASANLTARSVFTSGAGSTRAGLTCAALREDGEWQLEAGALVLSDGGVCCIDEISQLREHDRTAIHEAMEQQTISIAKAGIVCKLNTRCAVIAACNPKGQYQTDQPLSANVSMGTPLLSRFDLIFILLDAKNKSWDELVSSYILFGGSKQESKNIWSIEKLQMYISLVGPRSTKMTKSANTILQSYYMMQRKSQHRDPSRTTVRMLDSLVRLSQAHCRLMYRTTILPMDAIIAISLVDLSMQDYTLDDTIDALHTTFPKHPDYDYLLTAKKLLSRLHLNEIWQSELLYYGKVLQIDHQTLERKINNGDCNLFSKYDNVSDDNIPLSASLITSSYFKDKKSKEVCNKVIIDNCDSDKSSKVSEKLAATLKKLKNVENKVPDIPKKPNSRKRKHRHIKQSRKKIKKVVSSEESDSDKSSDCNVLNAVPSVYDAFNNLGIDFKFNNTDSQEKHRKCIDGINISGNKKSIEKDDIEGKIGRINIGHNNDTKNKLKQFQFVETHNLNRFYEESSMSKADNTVTTLQNLNENQSKSGMSSSQVSIFESSDCDIDLDI
ncbi:hypothetical protein ACJJTC_019831 [Scirpophaga incertulas]